MKKKLCLFGILLLIFTTFSPGFAFDKVKFAVISDPHISIPEQKGVTDGYKLGFKDPDACRDHGG